jgi:trimeric autotransporter adhesin
MKPQFFATLGRVVCVSILFSAIFALPAWSAQCTSGTLPTGPTAFVVTAPNLVSVLDASANSVVCTFAVGSTLTSSPTNLAVSPDGSKVFVENDAEASISVIDLTAVTVTTISLATSDGYCTSSCGGTAGMTANLAVSPDGTFLYVVSLPPASGIVAGTTTPILNVITIPSLSISTSTSLLSTAVNGPGLGIAFVPGLAGTVSEAYIATEGQTYELTGDTTSATVAAITANGGSAAVGQLGDIAYLVDDAPAANTVSQIATATNTVSTLNPTTTCSQADAITITPDETLSLYTCPGNNFVQAVTTSSNTVDATVTSITGPQGIAITADGVSAYVAQNTGTISVIPIATIAATPTVTTIPGSAALAGIAFRPVQLSVTPNPQNVPTGTTFQFASGLEYAYGTVTWSVSCTVGGAACGSVSSTGLYTAPLTIPSPNDVRVIATSTEIAKESLQYPAQSASTAVTITPSQLVFTLEPANGTAGTALGSFTVSVEDAMGNVDTAISTGSVTLTSTGVITSGTNPEPIVNGVATFPDIVFDKAAASGYTLTAASPGLTSTTSTTFTIAPGTATQLIFTTQPPANGTAGTPLTPAVVVSLEDSDGNVVTTDSTSPVTISSTAAGVGGTTTVTAASGVATFGNLVFTTVGTYTLTATSTGPTLTSSASTSVTIAPGTATQLIFTTQPPANGTAGTPLAPAVVVSLEDSDGNVVTTDSTSPVTISSTAAGVGGTTTVTAASGIATFSNLVFTKTGTYTLTAKSTGPTLTSPASSSVTIGPGTATQLLFTTQPPANGTAGAALTPAVVVSIEDANGNVVTTNSTASVTISSTAAGVGGTTNATAASGVATFSNLVFTKTGTYTLTATSTGPTLTSSASSAVTIAPGTATQLLFTTQPPANGTAGIALSPAVVASLEDSNGNVVTTNSTASITISSTAAGVGGTTNVTATNGVATFSNLVFTKVGAYTLTATSAGPTLTSSASTSVTIVPGTPTQLLFTTQPVSGALGGNVTPLPPVALTLEDAFNNVATNSTAPITISSTPANVSGTVTLTPTNGVATFSNLLFTKAGTYTLTATSTGPALTSLASTAFTLTTNITVTALAPTSVKIEDLPAGTDTFTATVTGDPNNPGLGVTWVMTQCGTSTTVLAPCGTVAANGAYTPPSVVPNPTPTFIVKATSVADASKSNTQTVTISSTITVTVTPATSANITLTVRVGTQTFTAPPANDPGAGGVTWSVNGTVGGSAALGTISQTTGVYTAPSVVPPAAASITITATAVDDTTKSGSSTITIVTDSAAIATGSPSTITIATTANSGSTTLDLFGPVPADNVTLTFACTGFGTLTGASCAFNPNPVLPTNLSATATTPVGVILNVTRATSGAVMPSGRSLPLGGGPSAGFANWKITSLVFALGLLGLLSLRLLPIPGQGTRRGLAFVFLLCLMAGCMTACAQFSTPGTPSSPVAPTLASNGNLTITITPSGAGAANFKTTTVIVPYNVQ